MLVGPFMMITKSHEQRVQESDFNLGKNESSEQGKNNYVVDNGLSRKCHNNKFYVAIHYSI